jgi:hypothetical protein
MVPMSARHLSWPTAQQTAVTMNTTSAEVCRLLSVGRLKGKKHKQLGRPGLAQWFVNPTSISKEMRRAAKRAAAAARRQKPARRRK